MLAVSAMPPNNVMLVDIDKNAIFLSVSFNLLTAEFL